MGLCYKAWRESESRFTFAATTMAIIVSAMVLLHDIIARTILHFSGAYRFDDFAIRHVFGFPKGVFMIFVLMLGAGGLLRERTQGTIGFTLALPVSRERLLLSRVLVGLGEVSLLALFPALALVTLSPLIGQTFAVLDATRFAVVWIVCGALIFAVTFLISSLFSGEIIDIVGGYLVVMFQAVIAKWPPIARFQINIAWVMNGRGFVQTDVNGVVSTGPLPWVRLAVIASIAAVLLLVSVEVVRRRDLA